MYSFHWAPEQRPCQTEAGRVCCPFGLNFSVTTLSRLSPGFISDEATIPPPPSQRSDNTILLTLKTSRGGERTGLCLKAEIKNAAISNASSDNDKKRKEKMKRSHFIFITGRGQQGATRWPNKPSVLSELLVRPPKGILTFFDRWRDMRTQTDHFQYDRFLFTWSHTFV